MIQPAFGMCKQFEVSAEPQGIHPYKNLNTYILNYIKDTSTELCKIYIYGVVD